MVAQHWSWAQLKQTFVFEQNLAIFPHMFSRTLGTEPVLGQQVLKSLVLCRFCIKDCRLLDCVSKKGVYFHSCK